MAQGKIKGRVKEWVSGLYWLKGLKSWSREVYSGSQAGRVENKSRTDRLG